MSKVRKKIQASDNIAIKKKLQFVVIFIRGTAVTPTNTCGTHLITICHRVNYHFTLHFLSVNSATILSPIPCVLNLHVYLVGPTASKSKSESRKTSTFILPVTSWKKYSGIVSHDVLFVNPCWLCILIFPGTLYSHPLQ